MPFLCSPAHCFPHWEALWSLGQQQWLSGEAPTGGEIIYNNLPVQYMHGCTYRQLPSLHTSHLNSQGAKAGMNLHKDGRMLQQWCSEQQCQGSSHTVYVQYTKYI